MESARGDEENVIRFNRPVLSHYGAALDYGQNVALDTLAGDVGAAALFLAGNFVYFVEKRKSAAKRQKLCSRTSS